MNSSPLTQGIFWVLLVAALGATIWGYPRKYGALSGRSRLFRTIGIVLIDILLITVVMYMNTDWYAMQFRVGMETKDALRLVAASKALYGVTWIILAILTAGMAMLDSLENFIVYRRQRRQALDEMIQDAIAASQAKKLAAAGGKGGSKES